MDVVSLYQTLVAPNRKAIVGFIVVVLATYLAKHGLALSLDTQTALQTLLSGLVAYAGVWLATNTKPAPAKK